MHVNETERMLSYIDSKLSNYRDELNKCPFWDKNKKARLELVISELEDFRYHVFVTSKGGGIYEK